MSVVELKEKIEKKKKKARRKTGYKAKLVVNTEEFSIETDVRFSRITSELADEKMRIVMKSRITGEEVKLRQIGSTRKAWVTESGIEVLKGDIEYYQNVNGVWVKVKPFKKFEKIEVIDLIPADELLTFVIESEYKIWGENVPALLKIARWLKEKGLVAVTKYSFGGTKWYYGLIYPFFKGDKFILIMSLTRQRKVIDEMMPIEGKPVKEPVTEELPEPEIPKLL